jgi:hypothetical protein
VVVFTELWEEVAMGELVLVKDCRIPCQFIECELDFIPEGDLVNRIKRPLVFFPFFDAVPQLMESFCDVSKLEIEWKRGSRRHNVLR